MVSTSIGTQLGVISDWGPRISLCAVSTVSATTLVVVGLKKGLPICLSMIWLILEFSWLCTLYKTTRRKRWLNTKVRTHCIKAKLLFDLMSRHQSCQSMPLSLGKNCHSHQILTFIFPDLKSSNKRQMTNQDNGYEFLLLLRRANDDIAKLNLMIIHSSKYLNSFVSLTEKKLRVIQNLRTLWPIKDRIWKANSIN